MATELDLENETQRERPEETYGLTPEIERAVIEALEAKDKAGVWTLVESLHAADVADLVEHLSGDRRKDLVEILPPTLHADLLAHLDETVREEVVSYLGPKEVAAAVGELESDDAVEVIQELDTKERQEVLGAVPPEERAILEEGLTYPEESAGRMMQREMVVVPSYWTVGETIDFMRETDSLPQDFYDIFVVSPTHQPIGKIALSRLLRTRRPVMVTEIMYQEPKTVPASMDQEEVSHLFLQYDLVAAPVGDDGGRLVGVITVDDVVDVIDEEAEEDIMKLGGVRETDIYQAAVYTSRSRFSWLFVNLFTAIAASIVIAFFDTEIDKIVALAILMPIVASMGGNAGTQTLTVAVRALAVRELTMTNAWQVIGKETLVGGFNGVLFAVLAGAAVWFWFEDLLLAGVLALAMVINLVVAGIAGAVIPIGLARSGVDPAVASGVFLTTVTDVVGFFSFLGLAAILLL
ncbi:MAG: magnesium transporter [Alphaproteobacteria bacterium]|nr:magnesium transporter [Alphaproteobacteria bacterium]